MIYVVECSYFDFVSEEEWNDFYSLYKLFVFIFVWGFYILQCFRVCGVGCLIYFVFYLIDGLEVLQGDEYVWKGGGNFVCWQYYIIDWYCNLYSGLDWVFVVEQGDYLLVSCVGFELIIVMGIVFEFLYVVVLDYVFVVFWFVCFLVGMVLVMEFFFSGVYVYVFMIV